jgi:hypothetical protein
MFLRQWPAELFSISSYLFAHHHRSISVFHFDSLLKMHFSVVLLGSLVPGAFATPQVRASSSTSLRRHAKRMQQSAHTGLWSVSTPLITTRTASPILRLSPRPTAPRELNTPMEVLFVVQLVGSCLRIQTSLARLPIPVVRRHWSRAQTALRSSRQATV